MYNDSLIHSKPNVEFINHIVTTEHYKHEVGKPAQHTEPRGNHNSIFLCLNMVKILILLSYMEKILDYVCKYS